MKQHGKVYFDLKPIHISKGILAIAPNTGLVIEVRPKAMVT